MSEIERLFRAEIEKYVSRQISLAEFRVSFASVYARLRSEKRRDQPADALAGRVLGPLAEYSRGHRSEESLRGELAKAIRPFVVSSASIQVVDCVLNNPGLISDPGSDLSILRKRAMTGSSATISDSIQLLSTEPIAV